MAHFSSARRKESIWEMKGKSRLSQVKKTMSMNWYSENYRVLMKEIKDEWNKWRDIMFMDWAELYCTGVTSLQIKTQV